MARRARSGGGQLLLLLLLLGILGGAGTWNYRRNLAAEDATPRPYRGYSDTDLEVLITAYEGEIEALGSRYENTSGQRAKVNGGGLLGDQVRQFERVQRRSRAVRELGHALADREGAVALLRNEQANRERDRVKLFLRRLLTYGG